MEDDHAAMSPPTPDDMMSDAGSSGSDIDFGSMNTSIDDFDRWQSHIGLKTFGEGLNAAAKAIFPNERRSRYTKVYVLMLSWADEDPDLPVSIEILNLYKVFKDIYHFDVEVWRIPDDACHIELNQKVLDFVKLGGDSDDHLKIVYYAGHARLTKNRRLAWTR